MTRNDYHPMTVTIPLDLLERLDAERNRLGTESGIPVSRVQLIRKLLNEQLPQLTKS